MSPRQSAGGVNEIASFLPGLQVAAITLRLFQKREHQTRSRQMPSKSFRRLHLRLGSAQYQITNNYSFKLRLFIWEHFEITPLGFFPSLYLPFLFLSAPCRPQVSSVSQSVSQSPIAENQSSSSLIHNSYSTTRCLALVMNC